MYLYARRRTEPAGPPFGELGESLTVANRRGGPQCVTTERRIRPVIEPPPDQLVRVEQRYLADPSAVRLLHTAAYDAYRRLKAAAEADGIPGNLLTVVSGYRSVASQQQLWATALARYGTPEAARKWVAPPGGSPHHTGRAIDLYLGTRNDSANIAALRSAAPYQWLVCNAARFGFTPYSAEPWHWEF